VGRSDTMDYEDFSIVIEPEGPEEYSALVASPVGDGRGRFRLPFSNGDLISALEGLRRTPTAGSLSRNLLLDNESSDYDEPLEPGDIGDALFQALFSGKVLALYQRSLGSLLRQASKGLRIRLHLDPGLTGLIPVCNLPWEFLCQDKENFLSLDQARSIVRYLRVDQPTELVPLERPLRVLVAMSSPEGLEELDLRTERQLIQSALANVDDVEIEFLERADVASLVRLMEAKPYHVLHYMGHGDYAPESGEGALLFESPSGRPHPVTGEVFATLCQASNRPAVIVLNACDTARSAPATALDPFAGVAVALVKSGFLAVVAMQFPITDSAALAFCGGLYRRLAVGDSLESAVSEGRRSIFASDPESKEWATPVLFMRSSDSYVFDLSRVPISEKRAARRLLDSFSEAQLKATLRSMEGRDEVEAFSLEQDSAARVKHWVDTAASIGGEEWNRLCSALLSARSPFAPFDGTLASWTSSAEGIWQVDDPDLVGLGEDDALFAEPLELAHGSLLLWQGLAFRDGSISGKAWLPLLQFSGASGLVLAENGRSSLLGLLHGRASGEIFLELWRREGARLLEIASLPVDQALDGYYDLSLQLMEREARLRSGETILVAGLGLDLPRGFSGLIKCAQPLVRYNGLVIDVSRPRGRTGGSK
jgi:CHAT domain